MPKKVQTTKESIINAALELVRRDGTSAINARAVAKELGSSTQPIFSNFASINELFLAAYSHIINEDQN